MAAIHLSANGRSSMLPGDALRDLQCGTPVMLVLAEMNEVAPLAGVRNDADLFGETPRKYAVNSVRGFANQAGSENWMVLKTAIEKYEDAGLTRLVRMIDWALRRDAAQLTHQGYTRGSDATRGVHL